MNFAVASTRLRIFIGLIMKNVTKVYVLLLLDNILKTDLILFSSS